MKEQLHTGYEAFKTHRTRIVVILLVLAVLILPIVYQVHERVETTAVMPESLRIIQDDAFSGTNLCSVEIGDELVFIGSQAFPTRTVIYGEKHSYVESWAEDNGYQFVSEGRLNIKSEKKSIYREHLVLLLCLIVPVDDEKKRAVCRRMREAIKSMRQQDRPEMYPIDYRFP